MDCAPPTTQWTSERTLRLSWSHPGEHFLALSAAWSAQLRSALAPALVDVTAGLRTITLSTNPLTADRDHVLKRALQILSDHQELDAHPARDIEIPICFDTEFAPDLSRFPKDTAEQLTDSTLRPALFGFAPGFAYLEGLPVSLYTPRLETPRPRVSPGSVAIADRFAAVYPSATPGGWNIIGRTPLVMFDANRPEPALLRAGDRVRFVRIARDEFEALQR